MKGIYLHTGILLRIGGKAQVQKDDTSNNWLLFYNPRVCDDIDEHLGQFRVDNTYLICEEIKLNDLLYRLSRIINIPIRYDATYVMYILYTIA